MPHQFLFAEILTTLGHINRSAINVLLLRHERSSCRSRFVTERLSGQETLDRVPDNSTRITSFDAITIIKAGLTEQVAQLESENEGE